MHALHYGLKQLLVLLTASCAISMRNLVRKPTSALRQRAPCATRSQSLQHKQFLRVQLRKTSRNTITVVCRRTGKKYLVDCGADLSVYPAPSADRNYASRTTPLSAANGSQINTWVSRSISLTLSKGAGRVYKQQFILADVKEPILGADFFHQQSFGY